MGFSTNMEQISLQWYSIVSPSSPPPLFFSLSAYCLSYCYVIFCAEDKSFEETSFSLSVLILACVIISAYCGISKISSGSELFPYFIGLIIISLDAKVVFGLTKLSCIKFRFPLPKGASFHLKGILTKIAANCTRVFAEKMATPLHFR